MIILLCFSSWYLNFVCGCRCLSDFTVDHTVKFSGIASDGHTWTLKSHSYTKFDLGQYSWLFLDFTTKISRRKVRVLPQHSPSHNVHVSFLSNSVSWFGSYFAFVYHIKQVVHSHLLCVN